MTEASEEPQLEEEDGGTRAKKAGYKPPQMIDTHPCGDLNRYLVDKFHTPTAKAKPTLFEEINLSIYQPSAKLATFCTSENRILLWIKTFAERYYEHLNTSTTGYHVSWHEQDGYSCPTKCDKIVIHLYEIEAEIKEQLIAITVFVTTGRIMIQGKKFAEWSTDEFPILLNIVNTMSQSSLDAEDKSIFTSSLPIFFQKLTSSEEIAIPENLTTQNTETIAETLLRENIAPLSLTPSKLNTLATLRDTVSNLEVEFTESRITTGGNIEQLKDKVVQQDNLLKVQRATISDLSDDLSKNVKMLNDELQHQSTIIKKLQEENHALQKKYMKLSEEKTAGKEKQNQLAAEVAFLKDQIQALWQILETHKPTETAMKCEKPPPVTQEDLITEKPDENENISKPTCKQSGEQELLLVNLPTYNSFSPLQESPTTPLDTDNRIIDEKHEQKKTPLVSNMPNNNQQKQSPQNNNHFKTDTQANEVIFLCDSNGKFLNEKKLFTSNQETKIIRAPLIRIARAYLQTEIRAAPQLIIFHTGTNDLETARSSDEFIYDISTLITEASTKFPSSKIIFSTLLPRNDIPASTITNINDRIIAGCSRLPNVHLIKHDNLFMAEIDILHDNKHIMKRHIGLFAKNLKDAIHGRSRSTRYPHIPTRRLPPHPNQFTTPEMQRYSTSYSNAVKNNTPQTYQLPYCSQPPPQSIPINEHQLQQQMTQTGHKMHHQTPLTRHQVYQQIPGSQTETEQPISTKGERERTHNQTSTNASTDVQIPKEIISFLRFIKSFI